MNSPLQNIRIPFRFGSAHDPAGKEGLAALTARLMVNGSTRTRSYKQILEAFFAMACQFTVQVDQELTVFTGTVHTDHAAAFHDITTEMLNAPGFTAEDFERVRSEQLNALRVELRGSNDEELAKEMLYARLYQGHPYGHPSIGTVAGLRAITLEDVHACFARLKQSPGISLPSPRQLNSREAFLLDKPDARGVAMSLGHPIPVTRGHVDYHALLVAQCWLGQHRHGGRLFDSIREVRGLNYGDYAYIEYFPRGMYQFEPDPNLARTQQIFQIWLRPVEPPKALFALRLALFELQQMITNGINAEDFERTRNFLSRYVKLLIKTESLRLGYAIDSEFYGTPEYTEYITSGLARLTLAAVNRAVATYFNPAQLCLVAVGPGMSDFGSVLRSSAPTPITYEFDQPAAVLAVDNIVASWPLDFSTVEVIPCDQAFEC
jgi:zinc protease